MAKSTHFLSVLRLLAALAILPSAPLVAGQVQTIPEAPTLLPDVHAFEVSGGEYVFTNPYIPQLTTSNDHRIGLVRRRTGSGNAHALFYLMAPERLTGELMTAGPGANILSPITRSIAVSDLHGPGIDTTHFAVCDPRDSSAPANPASCANNPVNDCYRLTVVTAVKHPVTNGPDQIQLWSTPVIIEVENPKTDSAEIIRAEALTGEQKSGPMLGDSGAGILEFHTPMIVGDNRLLVVRFGAGSDLTWSNAQGTHSGRWDTVYAYDANGDECDIDNWTDFKPLTYAPDDPDLLDSNSNPRFGFAAHPIRSPSGRLLSSVPQGPGFVPDISTRYIWMDQEANNIFFATLFRQLISTDANPHLYDIDCVENVTCTVDAPAVESKAGHMGWMMMGLWTHGKMVLLDSMINHTDFGLAGRQEEHRRVHLFADTDPQTTDDSHVRVGTGQDATPIWVGSDPDTEAFGWIGTTVQLGSIEHFFNMVPNMRPRTPRDVVWLATAGAKTDEIAFDDYLSARTLIFSPMNALKEMIGNGYYFDGFQQAPLPVHQGMRLQNAATSLRWETPTHGEVVAADVDRGRIEHVALGGIKARGFHLDPDSRITYQIPAQTTQPGLGSREWLISLFFDWRDDSSQDDRRMISFPKGSSFTGAHIDLSDLASIRVCGAGFSLCHNTTLPVALSEKGWTHLAFHIDPNANTLRYYQNGFLFAERPLATGMMIEPGTLTVGSVPGAQGIGGWIDEFKVLEGPFNGEEICNHARGTLRAIPSHYNGLAGNRLAEILAPFENALGNPGATSGRAAIHQALYGPNAQPNADSGYYVCDVDYTTPLGISVNDAGDPEARSIRQRMLMPEGAIVWNEHRPDSSTNAFCTGCHTTDQTVDDLTPAALTVDPDPAIVANVDPRRQPMQPGLTIDGILPTDYFDTGKPASAQNHAMIDQWLNDGPLYHWPMDEGSGGTTTNIALGDVQSPAANGTLHGASFGTGKDRAHALVFDGGQDGSTADYVRIDHNLDIAGDAMTLAAWFDLGVDGIAATAEDGCQPFLAGPNGWVTPCTLIAKSANGNHDFDWGLRIFYRATDPTPKWWAQFLVKAGGTPQSVSRPLDGFDSSGWHHLAGTYESGELILYLDGQEVDRTSTPAATIDGDPNHGVTLGSRLTVGNGAPLHPFFGTIDDVRIYDRALLSSEIADLNANTP